MPKPKIVTWSGEAVEVFKVDGMNAFHIGEHRVGATTLTFDRANARAPIPTR